MGTKIVLFGEISGGKLCGYIEATSQDISQEVANWVFQTDNDLKHTSKVVFLRQFRNIMYFVLPLLKLTF
jgi:hypothetical protein